MTAKNAHDINRKIAHKTYNKSQFIVFFHVKNCCELFTPVVDLILYMRIVHLWNFYP